MPDGICCIDFRDYAHIVHGTGTLERTATQDPDHQRTFGSTQRGINMSKAPDPATEEHDDMRPEYDFSGAVRGITARRYAQGANVVVIEPDLLDVFPDAEAVNNALRALAPMLRRSKSSPER